MTPTPLERLLFVSLQSHLDDHRTTEALGAIGASSDLRRVAPHLLREMKAAEEMLGAYRPCLGDYMHEHRGKEIDSDVLDAFRAGMELRVGLLYLSLNNLRDTALPMLHQRLAVGEEPVDEKHRELERVERLVLECLSGISRHLQESLMSRKEQNRLVAQHNASVTRVSSAPSAATSVASTPE